MTGLDRVIWWTAVGALIGAAIVLGLLLPELLALLRRKGWRK